MKIILIYIYQSLTIIVISISCTNTSNKNYIDHFIKNNHSQKDSSNYFDLFNNKMGVYIRKIKNIGISIFSIYSLSSIQKTSGDEFIEKIDTDIFNLYGRALAKKSDSGFIGAGHSNLNGIITEFDSDGQLAKYVAIPGIYKMSDVEESPFSGIVFTGDSDISKTYFSNIFVGRQSSSNLNLTCFQFGGNLDDNSAFVSDISLINTFVGGTTKSFGQAKSNIISFSFNYTGTFGVLWGYAYGTSSSDVINDGTKKNNEKVMLAGYTGDLIERPMFIQINTLNGTIDSSFILNNTKNARIIDLSNSENGGILFVGTIKGTNGNNNIIVGKLDNANEPEWITEIYSSSNIELQGRATFERRDEKISVVGSYVNLSDTENLFNKALILEIEPEGTLTEAITFKGDSSDEIYEASQFSDKTIAAFGTTKSNNNKFGFLFSRVYKNGTYNCLKKLSLSSIDLTSSWNIIPLSLITTNINGNLNYQQINCNSFNDFKINVQKRLCDFSTPKGEPWYSILAMILIFILAVSLTLYFGIRDCRREINKRKITSRNKESGSIEDYIEEDEIKYKNESEENESSNASIEIIHKKNVTKRDNNKNTVVSYESDDSLINDGHRIQLQ